MDDPLPALPDPVRYASHEHDRIEATQNDIALVQSTFTYQNGRTGPRPLSRKDSITAPLAIPYVPLSAPELPPAAG